MRNQKQFAIGCAVLAAALYAVHIPLSKLLLQTVPPVTLAAFLYLGAGLGMLAAQRIRGRRLLPLRAVPPAGPAAAREREWPYILGMIVLDMAAPVLLMLGIARTHAANASLLNNFEIVVTAILARALFKEVISRRLWLAMGLITAAGMILTVEGSGSLVMNRGSLLVLGACVCWGVENNCTKMLSHRSSESIVVIKGCCAGAGNLAVARYMGEALPDFRLAALILGLGFVSYGLSINFYIKAQQHLGAAKTSAYYALAPFLGVLFSLVLIGEHPAVRFYVGLAILVLATVLMVRDRVEIQHCHPHSHRHTHAHRHGDCVHTHAHSHEHVHWHTHGAEETHDHPHGDAALGDHHHAHG